MVFGQSEDASRVATSVLSVIWGWLRVELAPGLAELFLLVRAQLSLSLVQEPLCLLDRGAATSAIHGLLLRISDHVQDGGEVGLGHVGLLSAEACTAV